MSNKEGLYGILGSGDAQPKIVIDGLSDVNSEDTVFLIHARRKPQGAVETVYDFLADNEAKFIAHHRVDDLAPKALLAMAQGTKTTDDPAVSIIKSLKAANGTLLLLWDEENPEASEKFAVMASDAGVPIKDLTNGLSPIVVESDAPNTVTEDEVEVTEKEVDPKEEVFKVLPFTRAELLNANIGVLRRQAKNLGLTIGRISKEEIVDAILGATSTSDTQSDIDDDDKHWRDSMGNGVLIWTHTDAGDGDIATRPLTPEQVLYILDYLGPC